MEKNKLPKIILVNPQLPENIGLSARAMMNYGFKSLRIVNPREELLNSKALNSSAHAKYNSALALLAILCGESSRLVTKFAP